MRWFRSFQIHTGNNSSPIPQIYKKLFYTIYSFNILQL